MTRLEPALQRSESRSVIETQSRRGSISMSRRESVSQHTETRTETEQSGGRAIFKRANRFLSRDREQEDGRPPSPLRHYERGHPLPANHSPERKAAIPFRNRDLGLPSHRRRTDNLSDEAMSGLSPQRHMSYSNFRRGDSQSRASPRSCSPRSTNVSPQRRGESRSSSHRRGSTTHGHRTSSRQASGKCTPSRRRDSIVTRTTTPTGTNKYADSFSPAHKRSPSQSSYGHSLDSEKLYKNLKSIASSAESDASEERNSWSKSLHSDMEIDGDYNERNHSGRSSRKSGGGRHTGYNSRDFSPNGDNRRNSGGYNSRNSRNSGFNSAGNSTPYRDYDEHGTLKSSSKNKNRRNGVFTSEKQSRSDSRQSLSPTHSHQSPTHSPISSTHSPLSPTSPASTPNISQSRRSRNSVPTPDLPKSQTLIAETEKPVTDRSRSNIRRGLEALILSENTRSSSQPAVPEMTIEDYVIIADIPRSKLYPEEEEAIVVRRRPQSRSPRRDNQHSYGDGIYGDDEHEVSEERGRGRERERGRDRREKERRFPDKEIGRSSSKTNSTTSGHSQRSSKKAENIRTVNGGHTGPQQPPQMQLDLLNCKKGWMYLLDEDEEWRKHWFVITDSELRYYRDSEAEERDEADGEIYLRHCLQVEEYDADKNYGLQLHMRDGLVTLSAMTSRIRRNWIDTLRRRISFRDSAESIQHADHSDISDRENSSSQNAPSRTSPEPHDPGSDVGSPCQGHSDMTSSPLTNRREAGEGRDRDQERRLEDRTKWFQEGISDREGEDPWEKVELKKGATPVIPAKTQVPKTQTVPDIERKWADFEQLPIGLNKSPVDSQNPQATNEVLQREVGSLRQQIEALREVRVAAGVGGLCAPDAPCALRLEQMEREHRERMTEIHNEHERERRELERDKQRLLQEEAKNTLQAMEALRKSHQEEIERLKVHGGGEPTDPSIKQQLHESLSLQRELGGLSERYSQQCVELSRVQNSTEEREGAIQQKEREMEQLRQENQELQARLTEEISLMRSFITGQRSGVVPLGSYERSTSELEMLLKVKESEVDYLHKEISCLRKEVQTLTKENEALSERYKEVYVELTELRGRSERDINALKEHLKLTDAALEEGRLLGNSRTGQ
ncbi:TRIO and F-actin-binding protein [Pimephales promelas]|uniref:TRIO and F-actin-binding protein n=1 Tax=Pimephales promelas TaxID=90988 RepID=UPI001955C7E6|nr:TRIO and F-actin-binding protein [Pimephales promelas]XP_039541215.1 TRIO and F-actin-binding protein [Pimephales promelas]KAG1955990.1 TRIO and F-actin-binding protein [Pimephales promelas]